MQRLSVLLPTPKGCYDYLSHDNLSPGQVVTVPFGKRQETGVVWQNEPDLTIPEQKLKVIETKHPFTLPSESIQFIDWVSRYTLSPIGMVLKMALISDLDKKSKTPLIFHTPVLQKANINFSQAQTDAIEQLKEKSNNGFSVSLLDGVTGSGKTEVYFEIIAEALQKQGQVLVLLPEITLTSAWLSRFEKHFGVLPAVWHSALTPKQRRDTWQAVLSGQVRVLVGARSALFLPFQKLNLIIVDEEHDPSYKQEDGVLYQARDMAIVRAKIANAPIILASATPSVETYCNMQLGKYSHIVLPERYSGAVFPDIHIADMRTKEKGGKSFLSPLLQQHLKLNLEKKEQSLLFINRRGYAPLMLCRSCGEKLHCPYCSAWLVEHKSKNYLQCHHCGYTRKIPQNCPSCHEKDTFVSCGAGVERIHEEVIKSFPTARTALITSETIVNPKLFADISDKVLSGQLDILIGTQILAKGHNFPDLTLVGIIDADMGLSGGDLRAGERTFQLLHQVMGRAGRNQKKGTAVIQSYNPENLIIRALRQNDRSSFLTEEISAREALQMPPFGKLAALIISGKNKETTYRVAQNLGKSAPFIPGVSVLGPVPAPLAVLRGKHRFRLLIKTPKEFKIQSFLTHWISRQKIPSSVDVRLDIDPYSFF